MRKLVTLVFLSVILIIVLIVIAFLYIDLTGHKSFHYDLLVEERLVGTVGVDRYSTEDKIVYKSNAKYPYSLGYPAITEKLFLKKRTMLSIKFLREAVGVKGRKSMTLFTYREKGVDFLFLESPRFIALKGIESGEDAVAFAPEDIMLYMPIMEQYNYWNKGSQFFDVLIPMDETIPPLGEKIEIRYLKDDYIPVMGRRAVAEEFALISETLPEIKIFVSKYTHRILAVELVEKKMRFTLTSFMESPGERISPLLKKFIEVINPRKIIDKVFERRSLVAEKGVSQEGALSSKAKKGKTRTAKVQKKEIFFESKNLFLSGNLQIPEGEGPFPAVLIVSGDGPMSLGEKHLIDSLVQLLSEKGFVTLVFDGPGQGKSQGTFMGVDDKKRIQNVVSAISYLEKHPQVRKDSINLIGYEGGGYIALEAALKVPEVNSCMLLGVPQGFIEGNSFKWLSVGTMRSLINYHGFGTVDDEVAEKMGSDVRRHLESVATSKENFSFFSGVKVPLKEYRQFISRRIYEDALSFNRPMLMAFGWDDKHFEPKTVDAFNEKLRDKNSYGKVAIFRTPGIYMGKMTPEDEVWFFSPNEDVLEVIGNWIQENGFARQEEVFPKEEDKQTPAAAAQTS